MSKVFSPTDIQNNYLKKRTMRIHQPKEAIQAIGLSCKIATNICKTNIYEAFIAILAYYANILNPDEFLSNPYLEL